MGKKLKSGFTKHLSCRNLKELFIEFSNGLYFIQVYYVNMLFKLLFNHPLYHSFMAFLFQLQRMFLLYKFEIKRHFQKLIIFIETFQKYTRKKMNIHLWQMTLCIFFLGEKILNLIQLKLSNREKKLAWLISQRRCLEKVIFL